jgi:hypothetical protein
MRPSRTGPVRPEDEYFNFKYYTLPEAVKLKETQVENKRPAGKNIPLK